MKTFCLLPIFLFSLPSVLAQNAFNQKDGLAVSGYDVISYFEGHAQKGIESFTCRYAGLKWNFASHGHLKKFKTNPDIYLPQYGGWCAYAMGKDGTKVDVDPETFEIRDGKLYLFYNAFFTNTYKKWLHEGPEDLRTKADENWANKSKNRK